MRSPSVCESTIRFVAALAAACSVASFAGAAPPTDKLDKDKDKKACAAAYEETQTLRRGGKLSDARQPAIVCARDACADFVRTDCVKWLAEIDASQPTVVFAVRDAAGNDTSLVRVSLDGKPWLDKLDGTAKPVDPGEHALRFEIDGVPSIDQSVQIREGEKNRTLSVSFQKKPRDAPQRSPVPWIVGGVGLAGLVVFGVAGGLVLHEQSVADAHCFPSTHTCDATGESAASTGRAAGVATTVGLVVGAAGIGTSIVLFAVRPSADAQQVKTAISTWATGRGGGLGLEGSF